MLNRILITGATGYIGSNLAKQLIKDGYIVGVIQRKGSDTKVLDSVSSSISFHLFDGSYSSLNLAIQAFKPGVVLHLASLFIAEHESEEISDLVDSNVLLPTLLVESMAKNGVKKLINTGTSWQYYQDQEYCPVNLYAATKQAFESIIEYYNQACDLTVINLQLYDTYGPLDWRPKLFKLFSRAAISDRPIQMSKGHQELNLVYISDVIEAYKAALNLIETQPTGEIRTFGVRSNYSIPLKDLASLYEELKGVELNIAWGAKPYRKREVMYPPTILPTLPGWTPKIDLKQGLSLV